MFYGIVDLYTNASTFKCMTSIVVFLNTQEQRYLPLGAASRYTLFICQPGRGRLMRMRFEERTISLVRGKAVVVIKRSVTVLIPVEPEHSAEYASLNEIALADRVDDAGII